MRVTPFQKAIALVEERVDELGDPVAASHDWAGGDSFEIRKCRIHAHDDVNT